MNPYFKLLLLTLVRIPLALVLLGWLIWTPYTPGPFAIALVLLLLIELSDFLDGFLARRHGLVSELGATLDPYADSTARLIVFAALAADQLALWAAPVAMALRDVTVAYSRILIARAGGTASAKWSGKAKAVVQAAGAWVLLLGPLLWGAGFEGSGSGDLWTRVTEGMFGRTVVHPVAAAISWLVALVTLLSMIEYVAAAIRAVKPSFPRRG